MISFEVVEDKKCERNFQQKKKNAPIFSSEKKERETKH